MSRYRRKRFRYGFSSGAISFVGGWALVALLTPNEAFVSIERWKSTLWVYLGTHGIKLSDIHQGGVGFGGVQPARIAGVPEWTAYLPFIVVGVAAGYTCYEIHSSRIKHNVSNAFAAGAGYFLTGLVALVVSDMQPSLSTLLLIALVVGGGIWAGSVVLGRATGDLPFIGIASFGTIAALGILVILGGLAILAVIQGLLVASIGGSGTVGVGFGFSRRLERQGNRYSRQEDYPRLRGLHIFLSEHWVQLTVLTVIVGALVYGISGNVIQV